MSVKVETKITIKFDKDKQITLSKDEAEILFNELKEVFKEKVVKEHVPYYPYTPFYPWRYGDYYKWYDTNIPHFTTYDPITISNLANDAKTSSSIYYNGKQVGSNTIVIDCNK
jgi:hypothetical protein